MGQNDFASLNVRGLRDPSMCVHLFGELSNLCMDVTAVQETHFIVTCWGTSFKHSAAVAALESLCKSDAALMRLLILSLLMTGADVAVKSFEFRVAVVYGTNIIGERCSFSRQLAPFLDDSKWLI